MLRRVVVENCALFENRQDLDFVPWTSGGFYTLVGENGTGKSSLLQLIADTSNLEKDLKVQLDICNPEKEAKIVCVYSFNGTYDLNNFLKQTKFHEANSVVSNTRSGWYLARILCMSSHFLEKLYNALTPCSMDSEILLYIGFSKTQLEAGTGSTRFVYVQTVEDKEVIVYIKTAECIQIFAKQTPPDRLHSDLTFWKPDVIQLHNKQVKDTSYPQKSTSQVMVTSAFPSSCDEAFVKESSVKETLHKSSILTDAVGNSLHINTGYPYDVSSVLPLSPGNKSESYLSMNSIRGRHVQGITNLVLSFSEEVFIHLQCLYQEVIGSSNIQIIKEDMKVVAKELKTKFVRELDHLSEGLYWALVVSALLVNPWCKTVLLDEPTRGMHPLQIRRLRGILMRECQRQQKCIIAATHSPEMIDTGQISLIFRFQRRASGYVTVRRVSEIYTERDLHFIGAVEIRELFFAREIIWVEGMSDKRFIEGLLKHFDDGSEELWSALLPDNRKSPRELSDVRQSSGVDKEEASALDMDVENSDGNGTVCYTNDDLKFVQEIVRGCTVLAIGGKKNVHKAASISRDLGIQHALICDLDAIIPSSRDRAVRLQYDACGGNWEQAVILNPERILLDPDECPASKCVENPAKLDLLLSCKTVQDVFEFYEKEVNLFTWRAEGGEIEHAVRLTRSQFGKKMWPDMSTRDIQELILDLLQPSRIREKNPRDKDAYREPNKELLRCINFLIRFFKRCS